jgi:hypothetical protein
MGEAKKYLQNFGEKVLAKQLLGRSKRRWQDHVYLRKVGC